MELFCRKIGEGQPLIILHGLYGSSDNWLPIAKMLADYFTVYIPDLRNHGKSFHSDTHTYEAITNDIYLLIQKEKIQKTSILGHSMGGKAAVFCAKYFPELINKIVVADISPFPYNLNENSIDHYYILSSLQKINLTNCSKYADIEKELLIFFDDERLRNFLQKNVKKERDGKMKWLINLPVLVNSLSEIFKGIDNNDKIEIPFLFIKGENSNYISKNDEKQINDVFLNYKIETISNAGHWLHAEQPEKFISIVKKWLI